MCWTPKLARLVGVLLVFSPLYVGVFHVGDPTYLLVAAECRGGEIEEMVSVLGPVAGLVLVLWGQRGRIRRV